MAEPPLTTAERPASKTKEEVIKEAKRIEEALLYSSRGHFTAARIWGNLHFWVGIPMVICSSIAGAAALAKFDPDRVVAGSLSIFVAVLSAVSTFLNPNERVASHQHAGNSYDSLMNRVRIFWSIECWQTDSDQALTERLRHFSDQKDDLNRKCPQIPRSAYKRAKKGIEAGEAQYAVDAEGIGT